MVMKVRHYADGGKVVLPGPETRRIKPAPLPPPKKGPKPKKLADGGKIAMKGRKSSTRVSAMDAIRGTVRRRQEQALGLRDGGKVKRKR